MSETIQISKATLKKGGIGGVIGFLAICCCCSMVLMLSPDSSSDTEVASVINADNDVEILSTNEENQLVTDEPEILNTQLPTSTITPTPEPTITSTPEPTFTPTAPPTPIILSGTGDSVVDVEPSVDPRIAKITYTGGSNFVVRNYGLDGQRINLLVNTIGQYQGIVPIDFMVSELTSRFEIFASGPWTIELLPINAAETLEAPGTFQGQGDFVFILSGATPDTAIINHTGGSNFVVRAYGNRRRLLVNEIGSYQGTVILQPDDLIFEIIAEGSWSVEVTTR